MYNFQIVFLIYFVCSITCLPQQSKPVFDRFHPELGQHFEGDIILPEGRNALLIQNYLWPNGVVPYVFQANYTKDERTMVKSGMKGIEDETCVKFVPRTSEADYIEIRKIPGMGCSAMVGRRPGRGHPMPVNYVSECFRQMGAIQHELLHVLGLFHEQTRPDRDDYVTIYWENIMPGYETDFTKGTADEVTTYDVPYDYKSLMHYPKNAFSRDGVKSTIVAKNDPSMELGQYKGPSEGDLEKIRRLYNCATKPKKSKLLSNLFSKL